MPNEFLIYEDKAGGGKFTAAIAKVQKPSGQVALDAEVEALQAEVAASLEKRSPIPEAKAKMDLGFVPRHTPQTLKNALGDVVGPALAAFAAGIDVAHPVFDSVFPSAAKAKEFCKAVQQMLEVAELAGDRTLATQMMRSAFCKEKDWRAIRTLISSPPPRAWKSLVDRQAARLKKEPKEVDLRKTFEEQRPSDFPSSFRLFVRMSDAASKMAKENKDRSAAMSNIGCGSLAAAFSRRNDLVKRQSKDKYCGFVRLKMADAGVIAAKYHGANANLGRSIGYAKKAFEVPFWLDGGRSYAVDERGQGRSLGKNMAVPQGWMTPEQFYLGVRAYPIGRIGFQLSEHGAAVVAALESFPDVGGRPLFDNYWVVVPGLKLPGESFIRNGRWVFRHGESVVAYDSQADAERGLDAVMVEDGRLHPVLVGEHGGKCYFITVL